MISDKTYVDPTINSNFVVGFDAVAASSLFVCVLQRFARGETCIEREAARLVGSKRLVIFPVFPRLWDDHYLSLTDTRVSEQREGTE